MFHFPTFPPDTLCVQVRVTGHDSSWVSPFGHPRITARLPTPRGLSQAPTSFIGSWCQGIHHVHLVACHYYYKDARVHCVVLKQQPATPTPTPSRRGRRKARPESTGPTSPSHRRSHQAPDPSGPNSVPTTPHPLRLEVPHQQAGSTDKTSGKDAVNSRRSTSEQPPPQDTRLRSEGNMDPPTRKRAGRPVMLLRKEVIQPHLPVRLPCYDFVPIASPTFDGSLPQGVRPPASGVADFRDVTGGVYKARERIHRSVADLRLLATPTSWGRVADPNPN